MNSIKEPLFRGKPQVRMHAMIKAAGPVCNLGCDYCNYPGKFDKALDEAKAKGWTIVDMKNDFARVFSFEE